MKRDEQSSQTISAYHFICQDTIKIVVIQAKKPSQALHMNYGMSNYQLSRACSTEHHLYRMNMADTAHAQPPALHICKGSRSATLSATLPASGMHWDRLIKGKAVTTSSRLRRVCWVTRLTCICMGAACSTKAARTCARMVGGIGQDMRLHCTKRGSIHQAHLHLVWVQLALQEVRLRLHISLQHFGKTVPLGAALLEGSLIKCGSCKSREDAIRGSHKLHNLGRTDERAVYRLWQVMLTQKLESHRPPHAGQTRFPLLTSLTESTAVQKVPHTSAQKLQMFTSRPEPARPSSQQAAPTLPEALSFCTTASSTLQLSFRRAVSCFRQASVCCSSLFILLLLAGRTRLR